jgi:CheY-like chemotaxis protein
VADELSQPLVAVINTSEDVAELLRAIVEDAGWRSALAYIPDLRRGSPDPDEFLSQYDPRVIVYDIGIPYEENWAFFCAIEQRPIAQGRRFVLTSTNKRALESLVGPTPVHELVGKPFDLEEIVEAVRRALQNTPAKP